MSLYWNMACMCLQVFNGECKCVKFMILYNTNVPVARSEVIALHQGPL